MFKYRSKAKPAPPQKSTPRTSTSSFFTPRAAQTPLQLVPAIHDRPRTQTPLKNNARNAVRAEFHVGFTFAWRGWRHGFHLMLYDALGAGL